MWRLCRQRIQRFDSNAKILLVPERHEVGKQLGSIGYGQRSFYRTKNVISKEKEVLYWNDEVVFKNCFMNNDMYLCKDNEKCSIFRTKFDGYEDKN